ncbi:hypothetical protein O3G_MSEX000314 [Manduca sexta]|nr:hypothetical protein O3G_MSEX000314 [Manduca sexta]
MATLLYLCEPTERSSEDEAEQRQSYHEEEQPNQDSQQTLNGAQSEEEMDNPTNNVDIEANTQAILALPVVSQPTKKKNVVKNKGIGKCSRSRQIRFITQMGLYVWLKTYWDRDATLQIMGKFVSAIKEKSLQTRNMALGKMVRPLSQIMKQFIADLTKLDKPLKKVSWDVFEEWALNQGLSTMYGNFQTMAWEQGFETMLYDIYGETYTQWMQTENQSDTEEEEVYSSSRNTTTTCMSSTIARTVEDRADADSCATSRNTQHKKAKTVTFNAPHGQKLRNLLTLKSTMNTKSYKSDSEKRPSKRRLSIENESEEEELILPPLTKKPKSRHHQRVSSVEEAISEEECVHSGPLAIYHRIFVKSTTPNIFL